MYDILNKNIFKIWMRFKLIKYILGYLIIFKYSLYKVLYPSNIKMFNLFEIKFIFNILDILNIKEKINLIWNVKLILNILDILNKLRKYI